jgi:hypothetical protein
LSSARRQPLLYYSGIHAGAIASTRVNTEIRIGRVVVECQNQSIFLLPVETFQAASHVSHIQTKDNNEQGTTKADGNSRQLQLMQTHRQTVTRTRRNSHIFPLSLNGLDVRPDSKPPTPTSLSASFPLSGCIIHKCRKNDQSLRSRAQGLTRFGYGFPTVFFQLDVGDVEDPERPPLGHRLLDTGKKIIVPRRVCVYLDGELID